MKGVQCYELFGGIALKIHTFSFFFFITFLQFPLSLHFCPFICLFRHHSKNKKQTLTLDLCYTTTQKFLWHCDDEWQNVYEN